MGLIVLFVGSPFRRSYQCPQSRLKAKRPEPAVCERRCLFVSSEFAEKLDEKKTVGFFCPGAV